MIPGTPPWIRKRLPLGGLAPEIERDFLRNALHTICREALCPNMGECFARGTATFLILGNICTRNCRFCAVHSGRPDPPDEEEPERIAVEVHAMKLRYVVITSVTRDDLPDGGADHFARVIRSVRKYNPGARIEVLVPDFTGSVHSLRTVLAAAPDVLNHNVETVPRLYPEIRPEADYGRSLELLESAKRASDRPTVTKSGMMAGMGETPDEVRRVMKDLRSVHCDILTIGQYLRPSRSHHPVREYVTPEMFARYRETALEMGFRDAVSSPFVRSSYMAEESFRHASGIRTTGRNAG